MQYELKTQVISPLRQSFTHITNRLGDKPATRYQEGSIGFQPKENFHYRPTWAPDKELYDPSYSAFTLTDPDDFTDPRQFYYTPYVTNRSDLHEGFGASLEYVTNRELFDKTPPEWLQVIGETVIPLRHYESGAQMLYSGACRFSYGTALAQCLAFAGFDRIGNAQMISRIGIALGNQTASALKEAKRCWMEEEHLQPLRKITEELMVTEDWAVAVTGMDCVDRLINALQLTHLDNLALTGGAGAYSLLIQHQASWYKDHRRWLDALYKAWLEDETHAAHNAEQLRASLDRWSSPATEAVTAIAARIDHLLGADAGCVAAVEAAAQQSVADLADLGLEEGASA